MKGGREEKGREASEATLTLKEREMRGVNSSDYQGGPNGSDCPRLTG